MRYQRVIGWVFVVAIMVFARANAEPSSQTKRPPVTATFSIVAVDPARCIMRVLDLRIIVNWSSKFGKLLLAEKSHPVVLEHFQSPLTTAR